MGLLNRVFGGKTDPQKRVRVCVECGMPVAEHKEWCSILRGQQEMDAKAAARRTEAAQTPSS
jgi:hypothetical protein